MHKIKIIICGTYDLLEEEVNKFLSDNHEVFNYDPTIEISDRKPLANIEYEINS